MIESDYFSPEVHIEIGSYVVEKHIILELRLDIEKTFDWATITFTTELLKNMNVSKGNRARIYLGYRGELDEILVGDVFDVKRDKVYIRNDFIKLASVRIIKSFQKCTPQEVMAFVLNKAGVSNINLDGTAYPMRELLSIGRMTALEAIKYIEQKWDIRNSIYLFRGEQFEWNVPHKQSFYYNFEYGVNILDLQNTCPRVWELCTVSVPKIKVLDYINVEHPKISGSFEVQAVTFYVNDFGFVRTKLTFKEV